MGQNSFDIRVTSLDELRPLFENFHVYASIGRLATYAFGVFEGVKLVAGYTWQPPPPGAAKSVCENLPCGVLSLSRMVALPKEQRELKHVSKPLRKQMRSLIDRTRWPVLVTYSDESVGHNGYVYECSGWIPTTRRKVPTFTVDGKRVSRYANGKTFKPEGAVISSAWLQRWEHWIAENPKEIFDKAWIRRRIPNKVWRSGKPAYEYVRAA